jgi:hypothetical protein
VTRTPPERTAAVPDAETDATIQQLGRDFWAWRDATAFRSADDIPRIPHPPLWLPRFDADSVSERRDALAGSSTAGAPSTLPARPWRRGSTTASSVPRSRVRTGSST